MAEMQHFVCIIRSTRPGFIDDPTPEEQRVMGVHFQYLKAALEAGTLLMAGPCTAGSNTFGLIVIRASSSEDACVLVENDPSIQSGV